jgi:glycyl-tRNA synthetase beta subunit
VDDAQRVKARLESTADSLAADLRRSQQYADQHDPEAAKAQMDSLRRAMNDLELQKSHDVAFHRAAALTAELQSTELQGQLDELSTTIDAYRGDVSVSAASAEAERRRADELQELFGREKASLAAQMQDQVVGIQRDAAEER